MAEAYLYAKFHLDPSNRLATVHERRRQDRQRPDSIWRTVLQTVAQKLVSIYIKYFCCIFLGIEIQQQLDRFN